MHRLDAGPDRVAPHLGQGLADGGQVWPDQFTAECVVEPHDRHVFGYTDVLLVAGVIDAEGDGVAGGEDRGGPVITVKQLDGRASVIAVELAGQDE